MSRPQFQVRDQATPNIKPLAELLDKQIAGSVRKHGQMLLTKIRKNASTGYHPPGRPRIPGTGPGPNVATGDYRRSWSMALTRAIAPSGRVVPSATVFTNAEQAWRLERGFVGRDALGRSYIQPPYPHAAPAAEEIEKLFYSDLAGIVRDLTQRVPTGIATSRIVGIVTRPGRGV